MKANTLSYIGSCLLQLLFSCKKDEPIQPAVPTIEITAEGSSSTDAILRVKLTDSVGPKGVALTRDGQTVQILTLRASDSLIIDEGLAPRHTYTYKALRLQDSTVTSVSLPVQVTTLDTTSHNWILDQPALFGEGSYSILYDCQIISDTLAYACGEIYLGTDPLPYNFARWNGQQWELMRVQFYTFCGQPSMGSYPAKSIFASSAADIWIGMSGSQVVRWNGQSQGAPMCTPVSINKLWGGDPNSIYAVGNVGGIAHYSNGTWQRMQSGTTETINDVWGGSNPLLGVNVVVAAVGWHGTPGESKLLVLRGSSSRADTLAWPYPMNPRYSVWFDNGSRIYTGGYGVFVLSNNGWQEVRQLPVIYTTMIRGSGPNDIMVCGGQGMLAHFNGLSWCVYPQVALGGGSYQSVAMKGNLVVAVGWVGSQAVAVVGHR